MEDESRLTNETTEAHPMANIVKSLVVAVFLLGISFTVAWLLDLIHICAIAFGIQWVVFLAHALPKRSEKLFDLTGGLTFIICVSASCLISNNNPQPWRHLIVSGCVLIWASRLSSFLFRRICHDGKDGRFDKIKPNTLRFWNAWNFQGAWVFLTSSPVLIVNSHATDLTRGMIWIEILGVALFVIGFGIEVVADFQKTRWNSRYKGQFIDSGLWRYSRHPNYFGEILLWIGIFVACSSEFHGFQWLAILSPLTVTLLLTKVSGIPMTEHAADKKWGSDAKYIAYKQKVNALILGPRRG
eukprot:c27227_g1_i1.p1 GENE.c27227_g1_i1~~c27227_g1_i1.p1  ORF type:complete len:299 (+),score=65.22 c27227_g1_i1:43-939(+)